MRSFTTHVRGNAVAYLALFVALGGTSYAAARLPARSVGRKQLKANAVNSAKVKNRSLLAADFKAGQLPAGPAGNVGPEGPAGLRGPAGDQGLQGPAGPTAAFVQGTVSSSVATDGNPDALVATATFTLPQSGRLWVQARGSVSINCSTPQTTVHAGIYVDGTSPGTFAATAVGAAEDLATGNGGATARYDTFGLTPTLSAGSHTVQFRTDCPASSNTSVINGGDDGAIGAVMIAP